MLLGISQANVSNSHSTEVFIQSVFLFHARICDLSEAGSDRLRAAAPETVCPLGRPHTVAFTMLI